MHSATATHDHRIGDLSFCLEDAAVHSVRWAGVEVVRGVSAPIRSRDWGTVAEITEDHEVIRHPDRITVIRRFSLAGVSSHGSLRIDASADGKLTIDWVFEPDVALDVNRAGLCILHPLIGVEGTALRITAPDGTVTDTVFPIWISPAQPAKNFVALRHEVCGVVVKIDLEGDIFEMEDQRNWSDASYKTYCRPLSRPFPYSLNASETVRQRMVLHASGAPDINRAANESAAPAVMPDILLAAEPGWITGPTPDRCGYLARFGPEDDWSASDLAALSAAPFDAEFVIPGDDSVTEVLGRWSQRFQDAGLEPQHVIALPQSFLKSYQPDGPWPDGVKPDDCARAARAVFPGARIGVGMLTNFTELNRCPPPEGLGDYITHGNSAIVHAADDRSVLQTLEAIPAIFASAKAIASDRCYRLGLCSIAMRSNPYGESLQDNADGVRKTMTGVDPRQGSDFAAAYAIVVAAHAALAGAEAICLGAPAGPFGIAGPLEQAVARLAAMASKQATIDLSGPHVVIDCDGTRLVANGALTDWADAPGGPLAGASWRAVERGGRT